MGPQPLEIVWSRFWERLDHFGLRCFLMLTFITCLSLFRITVQFWILKIDAHLPGSHTDLSRLHPELKDVVKQVWQSKVDGTPYRLPTKLRLTRQALRIWNKNSLGNLHERERLLLHEVSETQINLVCFKNKNSLKVSCKNCLNWRIDAD